MAFDWAQATTVVVTALGGIGTGIVAAWGFIKKARADAAIAVSEKSQAEANVKVADAQGNLYDLMDRRLKALETQVDEQGKSLREQATQLILRDTRIALLEAHISRLEQAMREAGLTPPVLVLQPL